MARINIKGPIIFNDDKWIYDWLGYESACPNDVIEVLSQLNGEDVDVIINSGGGYVSAGSEMYTALMEYSGNVNIKIVGVAASAASVIAMAGSNIGISPTAQMMIHNVRGLAEGDYRDMEHSAEFLRTFNQSIANAYILKTNLSEEKLLDLMNKETWMNAQEAKELGFVDEIMFDTTNKLVASNGGLLPENVINKLRNELKDTLPKDPEKPEKTINKKKNIKAKLLLLNTGIESFLFAKK